MLPKVSPDVRSMWPSFKFDRSGNGRRVLPSSLKDFFQPLSPSYKQPVVGTGVLLVSSKIIPHNARSRLERLLN